MKKLLCTQVVFLLAAIFLNRCSAKKCNCRDQNTNFGYSGLRSADPTVRRHLETYCADDWVNESILTSCWVSVFVGSEAVKPAPAPNKKMLENFKLMYNMTLDSATISKLNAEGITGCTILERYDCLTKSEYNATLASKSGGPTPTLRYEDQKVISNLPTENKLSDDKGPATNPKKGVYLFGYYYAAFKDKVSFYYVTLERNIEVITKCSCEDWTWTHDFFTIHRYRCTVDKNGCDVSYKDVSISVSYEEAINHCDNDHSFIRARYPRPTSFKDKHQREQYILCNNGTVMEERDGIRFSSKFSQNSTTCEPWSMIDTYEQCEGSLDIGECHVSDIKSDKEINYVTIKTKPSGYIHIKTDKENFKIPCTEECDFNLKKNYNSLWITCPNGVTRTFNLNEIKVDCPFLNYYVSGKFATYACRSTYRPNLLWTFILLASIGKKLFGLSYFIFDSIVYWVSILVKNLYRRKWKPVYETYEPSICKHCNQTVICESMEERHELCGKNVCPYCRSSFGKLVDHCELCPQKEATLEHLNKVEKERIESLKTADEEKKRESWRLSVYTRNYSSRNHFNHKFPKIAWIITLIIIFSFLVSPVESKLLTSTFNEIESELDEMIQRDDGCPSRCFHEKNTCCVSRVPIKGIANRKMHQYEHKPNLSANDTLMPAINSRTIDMTFDVKSESRGKLIVSGRATNIIELEPNTGITYIMSTEETPEKVKMNIALKNVGQRYKPKFSYWFADRKIQLGSDNACTGDCAKDCGCRSKTCRVHKEENIRNWRCNPTWCWNVGGGCSCCYLEATLIEPKYLVAEFSLEYVETFVELCVSIGSGSYKCEKATHNAAFEVENIKIKFSKAYGVQDMLPEKVHLVYNIGNKAFDVRHPDKILLDAEVCTASNCRHGEVGDYRFTNLTTMLYEGSQKHEENGVEMIWGGIQMNIDCVSFHWPSCTVDGVSIQTTDMFSNLIKISKDINTKFHILESSLKLDKDKIPWLNLIVRPLNNPGLSEMFVQVDGLKLNKKNTKITMRSFSLKSCFGCKNCYNGFHCLLEASLNEPESAFIHVRPTSDLIVVAHESLQLSKKTKLFNLTLFTTIDVNEVELCLEEVEMCAKTDKVELKIPTGRLSNQGTFYELKTKNSGYFSLEGLGKTILNFFVNIWKFIINFLLSPVFWILLLILLVIIFGPTIFSLIWQGGKKIKRIDFKKKKNKSASKGDKMV